MSEGPGNILRREPPRNIEAPKQLQKGPAEASQRGLLQATAASSPGGISA